jgi:HD superfamily phosphohydrolase
MPGIPASNIPWGFWSLPARAVKHIKSNGYLFSDKPVPIDDNLERDTALAALLHDVGHCPFSHLGEKQFEEDESGKNPREELCEQLIEKLRRCRTSDENEFGELKKILARKRLLKNGQARYS